VSVIENKKEPFDFIERWNKERSFYSKAIIDPKTGDTWPYIESVDEIKYKNWKSLVVDPANQEYYRGKEPKFTVSEDGVETKTMQEVDPHELVRQITRVRTEDGSEYLMSKGQIIGYDEFGQPRPLSYSNKERYIETLFRFETEQDTSVNRLRQVCKGPEGMREHYLMPFTEKNVRKLYEKRDKRRCILVVLDAVSMEAKECPTLDMFITKDFNYIKDMGYLSEKEREEARKEFEAMQNLQSTPKPKK